MRPVPDAKSCLAGAIAALTLTLAAPAYAALPPYWQSAREIEAIVKDPRVHDAFKYEEPIISIGLQEPISDKRVYVIVTPRCTLLVAVVDKPQPGLMGAVPFELEVGEATCK